MNTFSGPGAAATNRQSFVERMMGAARLNVPTYEEVEHDESATPQAAMVIGISAVAGAIGGAAAGASGIILGLLTALLGWVVASAVIYFVGTKVIPGARTEATIGQVLRCLGFAAVPTFLYVFGFLGWIGAIIGFVAAIWHLIAQIIAIRTALEMSTGRAIAVGIIAIIIYLVVAAMLAAIIGVDRFAM